MTNWQCVLMDGPNPSYQSRHSSGAMSAGDRGCVAFDQEEPDPTMPSLQRRALSSILLSSEEDGVGESEGSKKEGVIGQVGKFHVGAGVDISETANGGIVAAFSPHPRISDNHRSNDGNGSVASPSGVVALGPADVHVPPGVD